MMKLISNLKITFAKNKLIQKRNTSDKLKFNVQNNNLHKQVALYLVVFIRSLHQSGCKTGSRSGCLKNGGGGWNPSGTMKYCGHLITKDERNE